VGELEGKSVNGTLRVKDAVNVAFTANDAPEPNLTTPTLPYGSITARNAHESFYATAGK